MAWRTVNGHSYYYESQRVGGRVVQKCMGGGEAGELAELLAQEAREERRQAREAVREQRQALDAILARAFATCDALRLLAHATLRANGYCQSASREWRKRPMIPASAVGASRQAGKGFEALIKRAREGDGAAVRELRKALEDDPSRFVSLGFGDMGAAALGIIIQQICSYNSGETSFDALRWDAVGTQAEMLRADLEGPAPTAVEKLLVDRIIITWVVVNWLEYRHVQNSDNAAVHSFDKRLSRATARHLAALRALAVVRRLDLAPLQNVQINLGTPPPAAALDEAPSVPALPPPRRRGRPRKEPSS